MGPYWSSAWRLGAGACVAGGAVGNQGPGAVGGNPHIPGVGKGGASMKAPGGAGIGLVQGVLEAGGPGGVGFGWYVGGWKAAGQTW